MRVMKIILWVLLVVNIISVFANAICVFLPSTDQPLINLAVMITNLMAVMLLLSVLALVREAS